MSTPSAPRQVRAAGVVVALQALAGLVFAVAVLVRAATTVLPQGENDYAMAGYFALIGVGVLAVGAGLIRGRRWARTPALVVQLLLLGAAWYAIDGAARWEIGAPVAVVCVAVLVLLFVAPSRQWAMDPRPEPSESERAGDRG
ncbi:MAG: hypothetical protein ACRDRN_14095 [Sciscionella sp.]